ncbi:hypothetical protein V8C40DRAFT_143133 [Trichoderma camerunense]
MPATLPFRIRVRGSRNGCEQASSSFIYFISTITEVLVFIYEYSLSFGTCSWPILILSAILVCHQAYPLLSLSMCRPFNHILVLASRGTIILQSRCTCKVSGSNLRMHGPRPRQTDLVRGSIAPAANFKIPP